MEQNFPILVKLGLTQRSAVRNALKLRGRNITVRAVGKWFETGKIGGPSKELIMQMADECNLRYSHNDFKLQALN